MTTRFGLNETAIKKINAVFAGHPQIEQAILYGSRAKGNFKNGSDIDLTLRGGKDLTLELLYKITQELDDLLLPYSIDLSVFDTLDAPDLVDHVRRVGVPFYVRDCVIRNKHDDYKK